MNRIISTLLLYVFLVLWTSAECRRGLNPCHEGRSFARVAATECDHTVLPPSLCRRCRIRAVDPDGFFPDCENIYNLDNRCEKGLADYVELNPCDTKRKEQLDNIDDPANRRFLDFFIYAICEECCDCVPFGALPSEYDERKAIDKSFLTQLNRGNCPVHARFDVCSVWPRVKDVVKPGETPNLKLPVICPIIETWFQSPLSNGWQTNNVTINSRITRFLRRLNRVAKCRNKSVWEECAALEVAQGRI